MVTRPITILLALSLALYAATGIARAADVFSPGDLSRAHASLSGLDNCTKCHPAGEQLSQQRCVDCHKELAPRLSSGTGFHGRLRGKDRDCWSCHHEHQGRDFALVDWGAGGQKRFDHARTGVALSGKHAQVACERCHDPRIVTDDSVKSMLSRNPGRKTFLGSPAMASCAACHFDEHRGQLGNDCRRCHGENAWKPAAGFEHARTEYPLTGKHVQVACAKCHATVADSTHGTTARAVVTKPVSAERFIRYKPLPHASCLDCHKDPHEGRFGPTCARCHTTEAWQRIVSTSAAERAFHDKTRYPLTGAHAEVKCVACHGPFPGEPARFKGLPFQACTDCHVDAHAGQLSRRGESAACDRCHDVHGYQPARFGLSEHAKTRYPLEGAHRVVACVSCHPPNPAIADRLPASTRAEVVRRGRPVRMSLAVFDIAGDLARCETCHADPHAGQLTRPEGCAGCHAVESFRKVRFDHAKTRFALTGKHATTSCRACHRREKSGGVETVRYRPLDTACASCHADPHAGQFAGRTTASAPPPAKPAGNRPTTAAAPTDCARCHGTDGWKQTTFKHEPPFTTYALAGKHARVACDRCHAQVDVGNGVLVRRYRPLPRRCDACHADFHKGAFQGLEQLVRTSGGDATSCDRCHTVDGWREVAFAHQRTGFPLRGAHLKTSCKSCHPISFTRALGRDCSSCHRDVHQGRLGARCTGCHDELGWATKFDADAHRRGTFPLNGKHAFIPCQECHGDRRDRGFTRSTPQCITCHQKDYDRTSTTAIDHRAAGFSTSCQQCHDPWRWKGAAFGQHDNCFKISSGPHAGISCLKCHTSLSGFTTTGACSTGTASCTRCHNCGSHPSVAGFACADRKCYECHRFSTPGSAALRSTTKRSP